MKSLSLSPITLTSRTSDPLPDITGAEAEFNLICEQLKGRTPVQLGKDLASD